MKNPKPRILFILHYPPPVHGAAMVGQYIKESEIINNRFLISYINLGTSRGLDDIGRGGLTEWVRYLDILWNTLSQLWVFNPKVVYLSLTAQGSGFYKDAVVALLAKAFGKKVVYHFHNKGVANRQEKNIDNWLYRLVFKEAEVILLSRHLYFDIQKYVPEDQVHYCPNGIPVMKATNKKLVKHEKHPVRLLFLSNLIASKGVYILLRACKCLKDRGLNFYCTFVGGEGNVTEKDFDRKTAELSLGDVVTYAGKKYGEEKAEIFAASDIFVFPTYYSKECFPLVLLEAMQCSLPIVSTREGGIAEIVESGVNGFIVPQKNAEALADKLEILINDEKLRKQMGNKGRELYEQKFTVQKFEGRMVTVLKQICTGA